MIQQIQLSLQSNSIQLRELFQKAITQENPAMFLFEKKARTLLFTIESLTRILSKVSEDKQIKVHYKSVKECEDALGQIDLDHNLYRQFSENKKIKKEQANYFLKRRDKTLKKWNQKLILNHFYQDTFNRLSDPGRINLTDVTSVSILQQEIEKELGKCKAFFLKRPAKFTKIEDELHRIRRKLRWISIYAQSFNGIIVLDTDKKIYPWEKKFITSVEITSPYNTLVIKRNLKQYIHFNKKAFLALSYVINHLGEIKDKCIVQDELKRALIETGVHTPLEATNLVIKQLNVKQSPLEELATAHTLLREYFVKYRIHELLLVRRQNL